MTGTGAMRMALLIASGFVAGGAQAARDVPPPLPVRPVEASMAQIPPSPVTMWRNTPSVMAGWSPDRHIPIAGSARAQPCARRALMAMAVGDGGWRDEEAGLADDGFDDGAFAPWEDM